MKKALISPAEDNRICQVADAEFPIALPLFWADCADDVTTEWSYVDGEFLAPATPAPVIPTTVSMRQARLALLQSNLLDEVNTAIASGTEADKITWEYATEVNRTDALVSNMAIALNLTETDLDDLFTLAATL